MSRTPIEWHRLRATTVAGEALHAALGLAALASGWLSFPLLLLACIAELVVTVTLSGLFFRERGLGRHIADVLKMIGLCAFLSVFLLAGYAAAGGFSEGLSFDWRGSVALASLVGARLGMAAWFASRSEDPRLRWTRDAILRGGVLIVAMLFGAFGCLFAGVLLAEWLSADSRTVAADVVLGGTFLLLQAGVACLVGTMSESEIAQIARNPYVD